MAAAGLLFDTPLTLPCGLTLKNRIIRAAAFAGGTVTEQASTHAEIAAGGAALTTVAYTAVSSDGRTFAAQLLLTPSGAPSDLSAIARAVHAHGCLLSFQLTHAGGFAEKALIDRRGVPPPGGGAAAAAAAATPPDPAAGDSRPIAPASVFDIATLSWPRQATAADMDRLERDFATAAGIAVGAGEADAVELHFGHGYLLSQWLCPLTNTRRDEHGGSIDNRMRFPMRVARAVRAAIGPKRALFVKLNTADGFEGGISLEDACAVAAALAREPGLCDGIIPSAGFVNKNGFFMLRGSVPRGAMVEALALSSRSKSWALSMLGRWLVPEIPFTPRFLLDGARAVLTAVAAAGCAAGSAAAAGGAAGAATASGAASDAALGSSAPSAAAAAPPPSMRVPVIPVGGYVDLPGVEGALAEGFGAVQMARALIRNPSLVLEWQAAAAAAATAATAAGASEVDASAVAAAAPASACSHCNVCVIAALNPAIGSRCVERPPPTAASSACAAGGAVRDIEEAAR